MVTRNVREMMRSAALCTAGWASITVVAALAQEASHVADAGAPEGALVFYLTDDLPPDHAAARVLRLLQLLGVHRSGEPRQVSATEVAIAPASTTPLPVAQALSVAAAPARLGLDAWSATPLAAPATLPPLPPLRHGSVSAQTASRENRAGNSVDGNLPRRPATAPPAQHPHAAAGSRPALKTGEQTPHPLAAFVEPCSADAVLEPRVTPVVKALPAARDGIGEGLAKRAVTVAFARLDLPPLERRQSSELISPAVLPQVVATNRRQPHKAGDCTPDAVAVSPPGNSLRERSPAAMAARPRQILPQAPPLPSQPLARSPALSPLPSPPQLQTPSPGPDPHGREERVAAAEPALLRVAVRESRLLRTSENVVRVVPEHDGFCDVLVFNPREVAVIGKKQGTVRVELWYDQQGLKRASYLVAVDGETQAETPEAGLQKIEQLIAYLFPASCVKLVREQDRLVVRGSAESSRQAVEIMSTVRRSQLIPVVDEVMVQAKTR